MYAQRTTERIVIDGDLSEPAWQTAEPATNFIQREPVHGAPGTERTEVRFLYDDDYLYVGAYLYDGNPESIIVNEIHRNFRGAPQDYFAVFLDTFHDGRNGYEFTTTAAGGQRDGQFFDAVNPANVNWDGVWYSQGRIHENGWVAEIAIPFNTLRFSDEREQVWGMHLVRRVRRKNELSSWVPIARQLAAIQAVAVAGELRGIEGVRPARNLHVKPYVLGGAVQLGSQGGGTEGNFDGGLDVKYGLGSGFSLDLTVNTDFSHVEADTQRVNLTRFPLFFPEKREFFQENAALFQVGAARGNEALLFHSRTIGLARGEPIPILGGTRLTGRAGRNYVGLMNIQSRSAGPVPATNFTATRFRRDILANSSVGLIFLNRQAGLPDDHHRALGVDATLQFFRTELRISPTLAKTWTPFRPGNDLLGQVEVEWQKPLFGLSSSYTDVQRNFHPEMGFVRRPGRQLLRNEFEFRPRLRRDTPLGRFVRDISLLIRSQDALLGGSSGAAGSSLETRTVTPQGSIEFRDGSTFSLRQNRNVERLAQPFPIRPEIVIAPGDYRFSRSVISYDSDLSKPFSGSLAYQWGDFYDGQGTTVDLGVIFRPDYRLFISMSYERNSVALPAGAFTTDLLHLRTRYTFSARMFLNSFIQYNSSTNQVSSDVRFRFIHRPLSDIYFVYSEQRHTGRDQTDRALTVKYTYLLNF